MSDTSMLRQATPRATRRNPGIDLLRIVGTLAIIIGHTVQTDPVHAILYPWHVAVFFFLSGWFWTPGRTLGVEVHKRAMTLAKPYLFWFGLIGLIYFPIVIAQHQTLAALWKPLWGGGLASRPFTTFWFVSALFFSALLFRIIETWPWWLQLAVTGAGLAVAFLAGPELSDAPLSIGTAFPVLAIMYAGKMARARSRDLGWPVGLVAIGVGAALSQAGGPVNIKNGDWGTPIVSVLAAVLISWGAVLIFDRVGRGIAPVAAKHISALSQAGLVAVLAHPAALWLLGVSVDVPQVWVIAVVIVAPYALGWVLLRTPLAQWATGARQAGPSLRTVR